ncbi:benzoate-CoA ligase family protein [Desulfosporosinus sp. BICA1-9]|uniref:benzoate-CoA ligase family protein n=1 Tax=Desulfosporosinus sp. BICA1-9 TaxID=1531958 RepID=UPI00054B94ED|nr:benzoate-CoA ligase family protein [Desulfosporosinus sp. BICA1-9]KJS50736.1 MAG: 4-hydroxybenzoate--CoA ligase [Peptococcaceae bacterium BRH_c23]KJS81714.1 MAG: 4-hydroxybenzoate--CoA ligase [Desulfosporosinus sp. BICA1-9]KJS85958.1 MAG: 4-hydroxybenzoate--CoA ligase [Desulfosporosinus sp. BICA1-9]HBW36148.1 benzoate-CoA ligase family protein [Desulfosporosinus sp.]
MQIKKSEETAKFNAANLFVDRHVRQGRGDRVALYYQDQQITYGKVFEKVNQIGNALKDLGVNMEDRVMLLLLDCPEFIYSFFGAMKIGAVPIPVNTLLKPADYEYLLNDSRAKVIVVSDELLSNISTAKLKYLKHIIVVGNPNEPFINFNTLINDKSTELETADTGKDDPAFWLYSSGTTGSPKGAVHLHHDMAFCAEHFAKNLFNITENDRTFSVGRLFFAYGLGNSMFYPFYVGASAILSPDRPTPVHLLQIIDQYKPTLYFGVPTSYTAILQLEEDTDNYDLSSIKHYFSSGEALPSVIFERWLEKFKVELLDAIGSTEVLHIFICNMPGQVKAGSTGKLVPGFEAKLVDEDDLIVPEGEVGTLMIKGDCTAAYYWNKHEKSKKTFKGEWVNTGDRYYQDKDGFFWYVGRDDDMLKSGGIWVSPIEVEHALMVHPAVLETAAIGSSDVDGLIRPKAFVVLNKGYEPSPELANELTQFVKNSIAPYKFPRWIQFATELPRTASGKIQRFKLRELDNSNHSVSM